MRATTPNRGATKRSRDPALLAVSSSTPPNAPLYSEARLTPTRKLILRRCLSVDHEISEPSDLLTISTSVDLCPGSSDRDRWTCTELSSTRFWQEVFERAILVSYWTQHPIFGFLLFTKRVEDRLHSPKTQGF